MLKLNHVSKGTPGAHFVCLCEIHSGNIELKFWLYLDVEPCVDDFEYFPDQNVPGAEPDPDITTLEECKAVCLDNEACTALDWEWVYVPVVSYSYKQWNAWYCESPYGRHIPDNKVHRDNMGPIWGRLDPGAPHVGPMNFAIWDTCNFHGNMIPKSGLIPASGTLNRFSLTPLIKHVQVM